MARTSVRLPELFVLQVMEERRDVRSWCPCLHMLPTACNARRGGDRFDVDYTLH